MALDWDGHLVKVKEIVSGVGGSVEGRVHRQIFFAGIVGLVLILAWKIAR